MQKEGRGDMKDEKKKTQKQDLSVTAKSLTNYSKDYSKLIADINNLIDSTEGMATLYYKSQLKNAINKKLKEVYKNDK